MEPWTHVLALCAAVFGLCHGEAPGETLSSLDASFCHGGLEVIYPELDIRDCLVVPKRVREKISTVWKAPAVYFSAASEKKLYILVMVDPDAKSRANPEFAYWQHWLVADIQGTSLRKGQIKGTTHADYRPPTPPSKSGFHRYQFMLLEQPADAHVTLTEAEKSHRGKWDVDAFLKRVGLGAPVATLQYLTQNYTD
ncbi:phosphatidylethanolamine-binding protein 4 [Eucyclogobius newberryi]|uniref:phosphatidylethanolamine-binding protein 4 n=1 Tax=Eucyclogobius newberryi TaxID=166745 RepID=UPI003B5A1B99